MNFEKYFENLLIHLSESAPDNKYSAKILESNNYYYGLLYSEYPNIKIKSLYIKNKNNRKFIEYVGYVSDSRPDEVSLLNNSYTEEQFNRILSAVESSGINI